MLIQLQELYHSQNQNLTRGISSVWIGVISVRISCLSFVRVLGFSIKSATLSLVFCSISVIHNSIGSWCFLPVVVSDVAAIRFSAITRSLCASFPL